MIIVIIEYNLNVVNYEIFGKLKIIIKYLSAVPHNSLLFEILIIIKYD